MTPCAPRSKQAICSVKRAAWTHDGTYWELEFCSDPHDWANVTLYTCPIRETTGSWRFRTAGFWRFRTALSRDFSSHEAAERWYEAVVADPLPLIIQLQL